MLVNGREVEIAIKKNLYDCCKTFSAAKSSCRPIENEQSASGGRSQTPIKSA